MIKLLELISSSLFEKLYWSNRYNLINEFEYYNISTIYEVKKKKQNIKTDHFKKKNLFKKRSPKKMTTNGNDAEKIIRILFSFLNSLKQKVIFHEIYLIKLRMKRNFCINLLLMILLNL